MNIVEASKAEHWNAVRNLFLSYRHQLWQECQYPTTSGSLYLGRTHHPVRQSAELVYMVLDLKNALADRSTASDFDSSMKLDYEVQTSTTSVADNPVTLVSLR